MPHSIRVWLTKTYEQFSKIEAESHWPNWSLFYIVAAFVGSVVFAGGRLYVPNLFWAYPLSFVLGLLMRLSRWNWVLGLFTVAVLIVTGVLAGAAGVD